MYIELLRYATFFKSNTCDLMSNFPSSGWKYVNCYYSMVDFPFTVHGETAKLDNLADFCHMYVVQESV